MTFRVRITQVIVLVVFVAIWEIITYYGIVSRFVLPSPSSVATTFVKLFTPAGLKLIPGGIYPQLFTTLTEIAGAFSLAVAIGLPLGFAIGMKRTISDIYEPIIYLLYSIPGIVLYPVIYLLVGVGPPSKIIFGALIATWLLTINTIAGLRQIKPQYFRLARSLRLSGLRTMFNVVIPAAAPNIIAGFRQGLALAIIGVVAGEILASNRGLGFVISSASYTFQLDVMYAVILLVLIIGFSLTEVMRFIERRYLAHAVA